MSTESAAAASMDDYSAGEIEDYTDEDATVALSEGCTCAYEGELDPRGLDSEAVRRPLLGVLETYRRAQDKVRDALLAAMGAVDPGRARELLTEVVREHPELLRDPTLQRAASHYRVDSSWQQAEVALRGLRELAAVHAPHAPPVASLAAVTNFIWKLDATLRLFFEGLAAVGCLPRTGERLLDWSQPAQAEKELSVAISHHALQVSQMRAFVQQLMSELHPQTVEASSRAEGGALRWLGFGGPWKTYKSAYDRIARSLA